MQVIGFTKGGMIQVVFDGSPGISFVPDDMSNPGRYKIYNEWEFGPVNPQTQLRPRINTIPPYVEVEVIPSEISRRQFFQQLAVSGLITEDEALAAVSVGTIPSAMMSIISSLPDDQKFNAKMLLSAQSFFRDNPLVEPFRLSKGLTEEQVDQLWLAASKL